MGDKLIKSFDSEIRLIDEEQRLVEGFMGDGLVDIDGHMIDEQAYIKAIEEFLPWGNIREMHGKPVGRVVSYGEKGWNHIVVKVIDDSAWKLVKEGVYKGFSIGARVLAKSWVDTDDIPESKFFGIPETVRNAIIKVGKILRIDSMMLAEISLVDRPVNPRALILSYKGLEGDDLPIDKSIVEAQEESIAKGEYTMGRTKKVQELTEDAQPTELEKSVDAVDESVNFENNSDSNEAVPVVEEPVSEPELEKAVPESETDVQPESEGAEELSLSEEEEVFDAELAVKALNERIDEFSQKFQEVFESIGESINKAVQSAMESVTEALEQRLTAIAQPVMEPVAEEKGVSVVEDSGVAEVVVEKSVVEEQKPEVPSFDIDAIVQKAVDAAISKYVQVMSDDDNRVGYVNKGDSIEEPEAPDFSAMSTDQKYNILARLIANEAVSH